MGWRAGSRHPTLAKADALPGMVLPMPGPPQRTTSLQRTSPLRRTGTLTSTKGLARSTPLKATKGLAASEPPKRTDTLKRTDSLARTGPPKARSDKMEAVYAERRPLVARILTDRERCEFRHPSGDQCNRRSAEVHEIWTRGRSGNTALAILDGPNLVALCRVCHRWVTDNPAAARLLGYVRQSWEGPPPAADDDHPEAGMPLGTPREPVAAPIPEAPR